MGVREAMDGGRILVVDDERFFQDLMSGILSGEGYAVEIAGTGAEAIGKCRGGGFDVVVLDLVLPDLVGTQVLTRVRDQDPELAVIMVTAYASMESAIEALKAGAYDYIKKPIVREDLLRAVERALERQHLFAKNRRLIVELQDRLEEVKTLGREKEEVFSILDEGLVIMTPDGRITDLNRRASALGGGDRLIAGDDFGRSGFPMPEGFLDDVSRAAGEPVHAMVAVEEPQGGRRRDIELVGLAMPDARSGKYLLSFRDLTGLRELERRREEFLAIVSHDLKTPLTSLKGFIELLVNRDYDSETTMHRYLGIVDAEADRMIHLINDLLDLGRLEAGRMPLKAERLSVRDLVDYCARSLEASAGQAGVTMVSSLEPGSEQNFSGDRQRLLQALMNLYANAIRFSPRGGTVETVVSTRDGMLRIEICDDGPGVPAGERERIFEKYHQAGQQVQRAKGSGLGLAIVRKVVELHGGSVRVEDREDRPGSRFVLELPLGLTEA